MARLLNRDRWLELLLGVVVASAAAAFLWAAGLSEVLWVPYFLVAAASGRPGGCVKLLRGGVRP
jgi:hypothetical protein